MHRGRLSQRHNQGTVGDPVTLGVSLLVFTVTKFEQNVYSKHVYRPNHA